MKTRIPVQQLRAMIFSEAGQARRQWRSAHPAGGCEASASWSAEEGLDLWVSEWSDDVIDGRRERTRNTVLSLKVAPDGKITGWEDSAMNSGERDPYTAVTTVERFRDIVAGLKEEDSALPE